jgi:hypothetical protein
VAIAASVRVAAGRRSRDLACGCACSPRRGRRGGERAHRRGPAGEFRPTAIEMLAELSEDAASPCWPGPTWCGWAWLSPIGTGERCAACWAARRVASATGPDWPERCTPDGCGHDCPAGHGGPGPAATSIRTGPAAPGRKDLELGDRRYVAARSACAPVGERELLERWSTVEQATVTVIETAPWEGVVLDGRESAGWSAGRAARPRINRSDRSSAAGCYRPSSRTSTCSCAGRCRRHGERAPSSARHRSVDRRRRFGCVLTLESAVRVDLLLVGSTPMSSAKSSATSGSGVVSPSVGLVTMLLPSWASSVYRITAVDTSIAVRTSVPGVGHSRPSRAGGAAGRPGRSS